MAGITAQLVGVRSVKEWESKPFTEFNDTLTTMYHFECICFQTDYEANKLAKGAKLSSAATAGLLETSYIDSQARWIGDSNFSYSDGGYIRFLRRFSRVPITHEDYSSTVVTLPPEFGRDRERFEAVTTFPDGTTATQVSYGPEEEYVKKPSESQATTTRLEFVYSTNPAALEVHTAEGFTVLQVDGFSIVTVTGNSNVLKSTIITRWNGDIYQALTAYKP